MFKLFKYEVNSYFPTKGTINPVRILQAIFCVICVICTATIVDSHYKVFDGFLIALIFISAAFTVITIIDVISQFIRRPLFWNSWVLFATMGCISFAIGFGLLLAITPNETSSTLSEVMYMITSIVFLIDGGFLLWELKRTNFLIAPTAHAPTAPTQSDEKKPKKDSSKKMASMKSSVSSFLGGLKKKGKKMGKSIKGKARRKKPGDDTDSEVQIDPKTGLPISTTSDAESITSTAPSMASTRTGASSDGESLSGKLKRKLRSRFGKKGKSSAESSGDENLPPGVTRGRNGELLDASGRPLKDPITGKPIARFDSKGRPYSLSGNLLGEASELLPPGVHRGRYGELLDGNGRLLVDPITGKAIARYDHQGRPYSASGQMLGDQSHKKPVIKPKPPHGDGGDTAGDSHDANLPPGVTRNRKGDLIDSKGRTLVEPGTGVPVARFDKHGRPVSASGVILRGYHGEKLPPGVHRGRHGELLTDDGHPVIDVFTGKPVARYDENMKPISASGTLLGVAPLPSKTLRKDEMLDANGRPMCVITGKPIARYDSKGRARSNSGSLLGEASGSRLPPGITRGRYGDLLDPNGRILFDQFTGKPILRYDTEGRPLSASGQVLGEDATGGRLPAGVTRARNGQLLDAKGRPLVDIFSGKPIVRFNKNGQPLSASGTLLGQQIQSRYDPVSGLALSPSAELDAKDRRDQLTDSKGRPLIDPVTGRRIASYDYKGRPLSSSGELLGEHHSDGILPPGVTRGRFGELLDPSGRVIVDPASGKLVASYDRQGRPLSASGQVLGAEVPDRFDANTGLPLTPSAQIDTRARYGELVDAEGRPLIDPFTGRVIARYDKRGRPLSSSGTLLGEGSDSLLPPGITRGLYGELLGPNGRPLVDPITGRVVARFDRMGRPLSASGQLLGDGSVPIKFPRYDGQTGVPMTPSAMMDIAEAYKHSFQDVVGVGLEGKGRFDSQSGLPITPSALMDSKARHGQMYEGPTGKPYDPITGKQIARYDSRGRPISESGEILGDDSKGGRLPKGVVRGKYGELLHADGRPLIDPVTKKSIARFDAQGRALSGSGRILGDDWKYGKLPPGVVRGRNGELMHADGRPLVDPPTGKSIAKFDYKGRALSASGKILSDGWKHSKPLRYDPQTGLPVTPSAEMEARKAAAARLALEFSRIPPPRPPVVKPPPVDVIHPLHDTVTRTQVKATRAAPKRREYDESTIGAPSSSSLKRSLPRIHETEEGMCSRDCAYWVSDLRNYEEPSRKMKRRPPFSLPEGRCGPNCPYREGAQSTASSKPKGFAAKLKSSLGSLRRDGRQDLDQTSTTSTINSKKKKEWICCLGGGTKPASNSVPNSPDKWSIDDRSTRSADGVLSSASIPSEVPSPITYQYQQQNPSVLYHQYTQQPCNSCGKTHYQSVSTVHGTVTAVSPPFYPKSSKNASCTDPAQTILRAITEDGESDASAKRRMASPRQNYSTPSTISRNGDNRIVTAMDINGYLRNLPGSADRSP